MHPCSSQQDVRMLKLRITGVLLGNLAGVTEDYEIAPWQPCWCYLVLDLPGLGDGGNIRGRHQHSTQQLLLVLVLRANRWASSTKMQRLLFIISFSSWFLPLLLTVYCVGYLCNVCKKLIIALSNSVHVLYLPVDFSRISNREKLGSLVEVAGQIGGQDGHLHHLHHLQQQPLGLPSPPPASPATTTIRMAISTTCITCNNNH
jgi:hypothetical protein